MIWWSNTCGHRFDYGWSKLTNKKHLVSPTQQFVKRSLKNIKSIERIVTNFQIDI